MQKEQYCGYLESPIGIIKLLASDKGITSIEQAEHKGQAKTNHLIDKYSEQVRAYFEGSKKPFDQDFDLSDYTDFDRTVWTELCAIDYGKTISYKELAVKIGKPSAIRAVANANARNPLPILIPCHRVIGSDGSLTGYSFGGTKNKRKLLMLEQAIQPELF